MSTATPVDDVRRVVSNDDDEGREIAPTNGATMHAMPQHKCRPTASWTYQQKYDYIFSQGTNGSGVGVPRTTLLGWRPAYIQAVVDAGLGQRSKIFDEDHKYRIKAKEDEIRASGNCILEAKLKQFTSKKKKPSAPDLLQQLAAARHYISDLEEQLRAKSNDTKRKHEPCSGDEGNSMKKPKLGDADSTHGTFPNDEAENCPSVTAHVTKEDKRMERKGKEAAIAEVAMLRAEVEKLEAEKLHEIDSRDAALRAAHDQISSLEDDLRVAREKIKAVDGLEEAAIAKVAGLRAEAETMEVRVRGAEKLRKDVETKQLRQVIDSEQVVAIEPASAGNDSELDATTTEGQKANRSSGTLNTSKGTKCTKLKALLPAQTSSLPFPFGCKVWYKFDGGMASGNVASISLDIVQRKLYYEIKNTLADEDGTDVIPEDDLLSFGAGCPVRVQTDVTDQYLGGVVLHGRKVIDTVLYTLLLFLEGKQKKAFVVEENVVQERVIYRGAE